MNFLDYILIFISLTFVIFCYVIFKIFTKKYFSKEDNKYVLNKWDEITKLADNNNNISIVYADKLLHFVFKKRNVSGTVGEQLKKGKNMLSNINDVWYAHKIRNKIAHDMDFKLNKKSIINIMSIYRKALKDLGIKF